MKNILFICHGNICRSPMAEFVMKDLVKKAGLASQFHIESAATSREEIGNPVYPPVRRKLAEHGISCDGEFSTIRSQAGLNSYKISVKEWVEKTNAIGLRAKAGRCGGTTRMSHNSCACPIWRT